MTALSKFSRAAYRASRTAGDANTLATRGPAALVLKLTRRRARREAFTAIERFTK